jgi:diacylglycerol kinase
MAIDIQKTSCWSKRIHALVHAMEGIGFCFVHEVHYRIELLLAALTLLGGWWLGISRIEWLAVTGCITGVLALEAFNTALEQLCNTVSQEVHSGIKASKDAAAAAVLLAVLGSAVVGGMIFIPKLIHLF